MAVAVKKVEQNYFYIFTIVLVLFNGIDALRKIQTQFNPGCSDESKCGGGLAYLKAMGDHNTIHYIVTSVGPPTILAFVAENTNTAAGIQVDWDKFLSSNETIREKAITLDKDIKVLYTYGIVFTRLYQYNDTNDKAKLTDYSSDSTSWRIFDFSRDMFNWTNLIKFSSDNNIVFHVQNTGKVEDQSINNGSLQFSISFFDGADRASELPHLQYSEDICQFDFLLKDIDTTNMSLARFGLEAVMFSSDKKEGGMKFYETKSIDDEYTPGVFKISNWLTRPENEEQGAFLQHKPVCYIKPKRERAAGTYVRGYGLTDTIKQEELLTESALLSYFGKKDMDMQLRMYASNFSFGLSQDGTFTKSNYTVWTASLGYGKAPADVVSSLVIGVISAGLGIPVVLILFGGLFVCLKKRSDPKLVDNVVASMPVN